jgi:DNA-binding PadR family transcriptional regulator
MRDPAEPALSLTEWLVLCVAAEKPTRGFAIAAQLRRDSALGAVWHVARPQVYRCLENLVALGLIRELGRERSSAGPVRQLCDVTPAGQQLAGAWLGQPPRHGVAVAALGCRGIQVVSAIWMSWFLSLNICCIACAIAC